jgi:hypothetical protein
MPTDDDTLQLFCNASHRVYTLSSRRGAWRQPFATMEKALAHAELIVTRNIPLEVYNDLGELLVVTTVEPPSHL